MLNMGKTLDRIFAELLSAVTREEARLEEARQAEVRCEAEGRCYDSTLQWVSRTVLTTTALHPNVTWPHLVVVNALHA